jgi:hypothetical protein
MAICSKPFEALPVAGIGFAGKRLHEVLPAALRATIPGRTHTKFVTRICIPVTKWPNLRKQTKNCLARYNQVPEAFALDNNRFRVTVHV